MFPCDQILFVRISQGMALKSTPKTLAQIILWSMCANYWDGDSFMPSRQVGQRSCGYGIPFTTQCILSLLSISDAKSALSMCISIPENFVVGQTRLCALCALLMAMVQAKCDRVEQLRFLHCGVWRSAGQKYLTTPDRIPIKAHWRSLQSLGMKPPTGKNRCIENRFCRHV